MEKCFVNPYSVLKNEITIENTITYILNCTIRKILKSKYNVTIVICA